MRLTLIVSLILAILAVVFALQNPGVTDVSVLGFAYTGSKALILIITFAVGVLAGVLATIPAYFRNRRKVSSLKKTIAEDRVEARRGQGQERPVQQQPAQQPPAQQPPAQQPAQQQQPPAQQQRPAPRSEEPPESSSTTH